MKRYIAFTGENNYPAGGAYDIVGYFDNIDDAVAEIYKHTMDFKSDFGHVLDTELTIIVWEDGKYVSNEELTKRIEKRFKNNQKGI